MRTDCTNGLAPGDLMGVGDQPPPPAASLLFGAALVVLAVVEFGRYLISGRHRGQHAPVLISLGCCVVGALSLTAGLLGGGA